MAAAHCMDTRIGMKPSRSGVRTAASKRASDVASSGTIFACDRI
jgi:hypothetical protein